MSLKKKSLNLFSDLLKQDAAVMEAIWNNESVQAGTLEILLRGMLLMLQESEDVDVQEKAMLALQLLMKQDPGIVETLRHLHAEQVLSAVHAHVSSELSNDGEEDVYNGYLLGLCDELTASLHASHSEL